MAKAETNFLIAVVVLASFGLGLYVVEQKTLLSEITAAYLQAIGSVAAIFAAIWIDRGSARRKAEDDRKKEADQRAVISELAVAAVRAMDILLERVAGTSNTQISVEGLRRIISTFQTFPISEVRDGETAMAIINVVAKGSHFCDLYEVWSKAVPKVSGRFTAAGVQQQASTKRVSLMQGYRKDAFSRTIDLTTLKLTAREGRSVSRERARADAVAEVNRRAVSEP